MTVQIKRIIILLWIFCLPGLAIFSQHTSKNNYTGAWETPASWSPTWAFPQTNISGYNITINGYITANESISFSGNSDNLIINDTLVIKGDLFLANFENLTINNNGVLIVRGNLIMHNHADIITNGYLIVTGYIDKHGPNNEGSLTSNDNPVKVFIGGAIYPGNLTDNEPDYPAINCTGSITIPYPNSGCSYGNMTDIANDPIYSFFLRTCTIPNANSNGPVCAGNTINLTSSGGILYSWSGPNSFASNAQNPSRTNATIAMAGDYIVTVTAVTGCKVKDTAKVTVNPLPVPALSGPTPVCVGVAGNVYTTEAGMGNYSWTVSTGGTITAGGGAGNNTVTVTWTTTGAKTVKVNYTNGNGCTATSPTTYNVNVNPLPVPTLAGPTPVCVGVAGNVYTTEAGMGNYNWTVSAGGTITAGGGAGNNTVTVTWTTTGVKTVKVNYTNGNGCTATSPTTYNVTVNPLPVPTLAGPTPVCVGVAGNVYTTEAGMGNYGWTVSAGGTITAGGGAGNNTVTVTWTTTGAKTVKVNYTNGNGCTATSPTTYNITVNPLPVPTLAGPTPVCVGVAGNVYTTEAGMGNYSWTVSAGGTITAGGGAGNNTVTVTWTTTGAKTVKVNYTNGNGCTATSPTTYNVNVNPLPVPTLAGPTPVCVGVTGNVYTTEAGMGNYSWTVSAGGTITAGGGAGNNTVTVTWTTTGVQTVTVNYTNGNGCTATSPTTYNVNVNPLPVPALAGPTPVCVGVAGNVYTTEAGMGNYSWTVSAGGTITTGGGAGNNTATVTWTTTGAKTVKVNYTNGNGCTATSPTTYNITVNPLPVPALAGPTPVCVGVAGNVYTTEAGMGNYSWTVSAGGTITTGGGAGNNTVTVTWTTTGVQTVTVNYTNGNGCTATSPTTYNVNVNPLPVPALAGPTPVCVGVAGNVYSTEAGMSNYGWTISAGGTITAGGGAGNNTATVTWTTTGAKTVTVNYTNGNGCTATSPTTYNVTVNPLPVATANNNGPVCAGNALNLTGGPSGMTTYSWKGPNGFTSILQNPSISANATIAMAGVYTLTITNASGCTNTATTTVVVNAVPIATASNNSPVCANNTLKLAGGPAGMTTYSWTGPNGFTSLLQNPSISANATIAMAGVYTLTVTNASGCINTATTTVVVNAVPIATANNNGPVCAGNALNLTGGPDGMSTYSWSGPDGFSSAVKSPTVLANATSAMAGVYILTVTNASGCINTDSTIVKINALPVSTASNNSPVCAGKALNLTGGPAGMTTYSWTGPGGFNSLLQNPSVSANATIAMAGVYSLTVTGASGCTNTATSTVTVNELPVVNITSSNSLCMNGLRTLTGSPAGGTFVITHGPGTLDGNILTPTGTGSIDLEYTYTDVCSNTAVQSIAVNENPVADAGSDQELTFIFETNMQAELSLSETGEWSLISGSGRISDIHSPTTGITDLSTGENKFLWKVQNGDCEASAEVKITVNDLFVPSVITPNNDGKNDYFMISENVGQVELIIFNSSGYEVYINANYLNDWDGRNNKGIELPPDTYFYILKFENGKIKKGTVTIIK